MLSGAVFVVTKVISLLLLPQLSLEIIFVFSFLEAFPPAAKSALPRSDLSASSMTSPILCEDGDNNDGNADSSAGVEILIGVVETVDGEVELEDVASSVDVDIELKFDPVHEDVIVDEAGDARVPPREDGGGDFDRVASAEEATTVPISDDTVIGDGFKVRGSGTTGDEVTDACPSLHKDSAGVKEEEVCGFLPCAAVFPPTSFVTSEIRDRGIGRGFGNAGE